MAQSAAIVDDEIVLTKAVEAAKRMYPLATVRVHRGRVVVFQGNLIRLVSYSSLTPS